jgi:DNA-binding NarL/FixJ family response regulator
MYDSEVYFIEAMRAGADGYLLKDANQELITLALRVATLGGSVVQPRMLEISVRGCESLIRASNDPQLEKIRAQLTPRELDVLRLLARGYGNRAISEELHLAEVTVKKYVQSVVAKVGVPDRTRAALLAARLGLGD